VVLEEAGPVPELTATRLFLRLEDGPPPHPNVDVEFETIRQLTFALGRLRERGLVSSRPIDPYIDRRLMWDLSEAGWRRLGRLCVLKPERRSGRGRAA
jgi:hypothetical protein